MTNKKSARQPSASVIVRLQNVLVKHTLTNHMLSMTPPNADDIIIPYQCKIKELIFLAGLWRFYFYPSHKSREVNEQRPYGTQGRSRDFSRGRGEGGKWGQAFKIAA